MNQQDLVSRTNELTGGDWAMAIVSFFLTPIVTIILCIYNFSRGRRSQGLLYLAVLGVQVAFIAIRIIA